ncbi:hypothetical protein N7490_000014, partial [Penicillium lividum]
PPATLRRVGPQHRKKWISYESHLETEFLEWWKKTEYGQKLNGEGSNGLSSRVTLMCGNTLTRWLRLIPGVLELSAWPVLLCLIIHKPFHERVTQCPQGDNNSNRGADIKDNYMSSFAFSDGGEPGISEATQPFIFWSRRIGTPLCLKQLLGYIRAVSKNKEVRAFWSDT